MLHNHLQYHSIEISLAQRLEEEKVKGYLIFLIPVFIFIYWLADFVNNITRLDISVFSVYAKLTNSSWWYQSSHLSVTSK